MSTHNCIKVFHFKVFIYGIDFKILVREYFDNATVPKHNGFKTAPGASKRPSNQPPIGGIFSKNNKTTLRLNDVKFSYHVIGFPVEKIIVFMFLKLY